MDVVIVESPAKAKTINKYLGSNYEVLASFGHVRDLPSKDGSVNPDDNFAMAWEVDSKSKKRLSDIAAAVKKADRLILATDPDREGEAISWHVLEVLRAKKVLKDKPVDRVVFNAITKKAVQDAMQNPRAIDAPLVDAYLARRALDYLVGFTLSPVLWRKLPGSRSAGRVQSVALRLVCEREMEIETFKPQEYWSLEAFLKTTSNDVFSARLTSFEGKKINKHDIANEEQAKNIKTMLEKADFRITSVESKPVRRNPAPPFTTSTLQQEASTKLGFSPKQTMQVAQRLYEGIDIGGETVGLITYMRTDGVQIAPEAIRDTRSVIAEDFGKDYLPADSRAYASKAKNAQEAHEAIRPTTLSRRPDSVRKKLDPDQARLYDLIWKRTVASQMSSAVMDRTTVIIAANNGSQKADLRATGSVIKFDGFLKVYEIEDTDEEGNSKRLPEMNERDLLTREKIEANQHFTEPPPRYSEASLIKKMEELGIGRPSTYAATMAVLQDRGYVRMEKRRLHAEDKGRLVTAFLESFFSRYVEYDFTADLEEKLDKISAGELDWREVLRAFWQAFRASVDDISDLRVAEVLEALNTILGPHVFPAKEDGGDPRACPSCDTGQLSIKTSRYGAFVGCSNYPECNYTRQLTGGEGDEDASALDGPKMLGTDPESGEDITLRTGRFGPYVQLGEGGKPKRAGIPKGWSVETIDLEKALSLLSLPREVGNHPETGKTISAGIGRYGPFVLHDGMYANLESVDEVFDIGINRAVSVLADKAAKGGGRRGASAEPLKDLGEHPDGGGKITVKSGRYGPYVNFGKINATLPKDVEPANVTLEQALEWLAEKAAKGSHKKTTSKSKKATTKKTTTKKPTAKKKTA
jgi:DNA topoisomerase-1